jgi:hypothetical protein
LTRAGPGRVASATAQLWFFRACESHRDGGCPSKLLARFDAVTPSPVELGRFHAKKMFRFQTQTARDASGASIRGGEVPLMEGSGWVNLVLLTLPR